MRNLFRLNSKNSLPTWAIYEGVCLCKENYIGEIKRNVVIRWEEHSEIKKISKPYRHLKSNQRMHLLESFNDCTY